MILITAVSFLTGYFGWTLGVGFITHFEAKQREIRVRDFLEPLRTPGSNQPTERKVHERWGRLWQGTFERVLAQPIFGNYRGFLEKLIGRADLWKRATPGYIAGLQVTASLVGGFIFGILSESVFIGGAAFALGSVLPVLWIRDEALRRERKLLSELPTALDRFSLCVEAGLTLDQAMAHYLTGARPGPLAVEFARLTGQVRAGSSRRDALTELSDRIGLTDFSLFTTGVIHAERSGTGLSPTLRRLAATLRDKQSQRAEKAVQELPVKMLLPLLLCIMPVTLIVVFAPVLLRLLGE